MNDAETDKTDLIKLVPREGIETPGGGGYGSKK